MKKPWSIASSSNVIAEGLARRCGGSHEQVEARGKDWKQAEDYTDEFARCVHLLVLKAFGDRACDRAMCSASMRAAPA
eukprot:776966-Pyramimonas_sp.AAC.1